MIKYRLSDISDLVYIQCENKSKTKTCYYILFDHLEIQLIPLQYIDSSIIQGQFVYIFTKNLLV